MPLRGAQTHSLEGLGSSAPSPAPNTAQCSPLASNTFPIPLHKFQLIRFQLLAMKNNKCEGLWGILGTRFCGLAAQVEAKGNYFLRLGNPCLGRKQIPAPPTTAASTALNTLLFHILGQKSGVFFLRPFNSTASSAKQEPSALSHLCWDVGSAL